MYFHTVKAGGNGVACALSKCSHDVGNLLGGQGAGHRVRHLALGRVDLTLNGGGTAGDNGGAIGSARVGCAASVPNLHEDASTLGVHRIGHLPPGCNLRVVVDARLIDEG